MAIAPTTTTRKLKFMCSIASGAHNSGVYSLNYDIGYSYAISLTNYNELNVLAYGYPYENIAKSLSCSPSIPPTVPMST